jgi:hypothetical protein
MPVLWTVSMLEIDQPWRPDVIQGPENQIVVWPKALKTAV